ncbi:MAG: hypothetical protein CL567_04960 [Alphaproteobacteria bacterium]|nr:hypothetical protein [Alphaproteobacteria bacterium]|tara:strand:- start:45 stop:548 length:504 start_codon:yes stop_codon:yes gene_type:complete
MKQKTLYLLRHGEANPLDHKGDLERSLTNVGKDQLNLLTKSLLKQCLSWDLVICSHAQRARQSLLILEHLSPKAETIFEKKLYNVSFENVLDIVKKVNNKINSILIVGHNPCLRNLTLTLAIDGSQNYKNISKRLPPGGFVSLKVQVSSWSDIQAQTAYIDECFFPE